MLYHSSTTNGVGNGNISSWTICPSYIVNIMILTHYSDVIMGSIASQITSLTIVYSSVYSGADQRKHQSSASLAFVQEIHRRPVNSPHKGPVTRKMFPFDDVIMGANILTIFPWIHPDPAWHKCWKLKICKGWFKMIMEKRRFVCAPALLSFFYFVGNGNITHISTL